MIRLEIVIVILLSFCLSENLSYSQEEKRMSGTDFWLGFLDNRYIATNPINSLDGPCFLTIQISASEATTGSVSIPNYGWSYPFVLAENSVTTIDIPEHIARHVTFNVIENKGIHVNSKKPVSVICSNRMYQSGDASGIMPEQFIGDNYMLSCHTPVTSSTPGYPEFLIIATEDSTLIEIIPQVDIVGHPNDVAYTILLNKGQSYQNRAEFCTFVGLTGTTIKGLSPDSECKPFSVFTGHQNIAVPSGGSNYDHVFAQVPPVEDWGTEFYIAPFLTNCVFMITALQDGTVVTRNYSTITLDKGEYYLSSSVNYTQRIKSNQPILVTKFRAAGAGGSYSLSDPSMANVPPIGAKIKEALFSPLTTDNIATHYIEIVIPSVFSDEVYLNGTLIPSSLFQPFLFFTEMSYAHLPVTEQKQHITSEHGFQLYAFGVGNYESYAVNLGTTRSLENNQPVPNSYCLPLNGGQVSSSVNVSDVWWSTVISPQDTIAVGPTLNISPPVENRVYLSNGISATSGCPISELYNIENSNAPVIELVASQDTVCKYSEIVLDVVSTNDLSMATYTWSPASLVTSQSNHSASVLVPHSGWYKVQINSASPGCYSITDSVYIYADTNNTAIFGSGNLEKSLLCFGDSSSIEITTWNLSFIDLFEDSVNSEIWENVQGHTINSTCGAFAGTSALMVGASPRYMETYPIDFSNGGKIEFYLFTGDSLAPCDQTDNNEDILLQYSVNNGSTWVTFKTLFEYNYHNMELVSEVIPILAQTSGTKLRIIQSTFSGQNQDVWGIDNAFIYVNETSPSVFWTSNNGNISSPNSMNTVVSNDIPTWYYVNAEANNCAYIDSFYVRADIFSSTITTDSISCMELTLTATASDLDNYCYVWSNAEWGEFSMTNVIEVSPHMSGEYYVSLISEEGCVLMDSVEFTPYWLTTEIIGDTVICHGDSTSLEAKLLSWIVDDFNQDTVNLNLWDSISSGQLATVCGSITGSALKFQGISSVSTKPINTSDGGVIELYLTNGGGAASCDNYYGNSPVRLHYSIDAGATWTLMYTFPPFAGYEFYELPIPLAAQTQSTRFRWSNDEWGFGSWAMDDVRINISMDSTVDYTWLDSNGVVLSNSSLLEVVPDSSGYFYVNALNNSDNCQHLDSVFVIVEPSFDFSLNDTTYCSYGGHLYIGPTALIGGSYTYEWWSNAPYPPAVNYNSNYYINTQTNQSTNAIHLIALEVSSPGGGCVVQDTALISYFIYEDVSIVLDSSSMLCWGDSIQASVQSLQTTLYTFDSYPQYSFPEIMSGTGYFYSSNGSGCSYNGLNGAKVFFSGPDLPYTSRIMQTYNMNFEFGGYLEFLFSYGDNSGGFYCDAPEVGEEVVVEYSINNGLNWNNFYTLAVDEYYNWETVHIPIPAPAQVSQVKLRWTQPSYGAALEDTWMIDNLKFVRYKPMEPVTYNWFIDGALISQDSLFLFGNIQGSYLAMTIIDSNGFCQNYSDTIDIGFSVDIGNDTTVCDLLGFEVNSVTSAAHPFSVFWSSNNVSPSDSVTGYMGDSFFDTTLVVVLELTKDDCVNTDTLNITVFSSGLISLMDSVDICQGDSVFIDLTGATNILWSPDSTVLFSNSTSPILIPSVNTNYYLAYDDSNVCSHNDSIEIILNNIECSIIQNGFELIADLAGVTYQWMDCNSNLAIAGENQQQFNPSVNGSYAVVATLYGCSDTSHCVVINSLGDNELTIEGINIFPNPFDHILHVNVDIDFIDGYYKITDMTGRIILDALKIDKTSFEIDGTHLANGLYYIQFTGTKNNSLEISMPVMISH